MVITRSQGIASHRPLQLPETKCFPSGPNSGRQGRIYFSAGLSCILLSFIAFLWAMLHRFELRCTLLTYAAPYWATLHPSKLCRNQLSYAAPNLSWAAPSELSCILLSYAAPFELCCTLPELSCTLLSYASPSHVTLYQLQEARTTLKIFTFFISADIQYILPVSTR
jgi:hypothetical protein